MDCTGTAVAWTRTILAGVQDFRQDPIALAAIAVLDNDDNDKDNNANDVAGVGRRTQGDRQNNPATQASDWHRETTPTKRPTESRLGATVRTLDDDGPGGNKLTNDESASGGRGRGPNQDGVVGTAVALTRTVLAGVRNFQQNPIAPAALAVLNKSTTGNESMWAARARPGNGRDSNEESNATNAKDRHGLQGTSGRVSNPQATAGAQAEWDDKKAAYVAAHGTTHHAAHRDRQGLPVLFGSTAEKNFQGKTGQRRSAAKFLPAQGRQHKKEAAITHGIRGGRHDHQGLPVLMALFDKFQGKTGQGGSAANFLLAQECQYKKKKKKKTVSAHGAGGEERPPLGLGQDSEGMQLPSQGATTRRTPRTLR
jgi:hypothetical protein